MKKAYELTHMDVKVRLGLVKNRNHVTNERKNFKDRSIELVRLKAQ